ncbi:MAG: DUF58 domain-containing protein [Anaerolineales bacterium]
MRPPSRLRWLLLILIGFSLFGWAVTGSTVYLRLVYAFVLLLGGGYLWAVLALRGIRIRRTSRLQRLSVGDLFEEQFEIINTSRQPCLWLEVENASPLPNAEGSRLLTAISGRERRSYVARTWLIRRGAFSLGPTRLASGDPFGLFVSRKEIAADDSLIVLPMSVAIQTFPPPPGILPGGRAIRRKTMDVTPHASGVREYVPGDPMKRIHWPSTVRRGRFMVKEFEQDPQSDLWLFLDAHAAAHIRQPAQEDLTFKVDQWLQKRPQVRLPCDTFEYAVSAAASLAQHFLRQQRAVGLACAAGRLTVVPAERGDRQLGKIMDVLAFLEPLGALPLLGLVQLQARLLPLGSSVILITSAARPDLLLAVEDLQRRSLHPFVLLIAPETFGGEQSQTLADGLLNRNVPLARVTYGGDLASQLAVPALYFERPWRPHPTDFVYPS